MEPSERQRGPIVRVSRWAGLIEGDPVVVNTVKERSRQWVFVAHARNEGTGDEWVEVRGGREGEAKGRSFRPEVIFPAGSRRGSRVTGLSLHDAPQLPLSVPRRWS